MKILNGSPSADGFHMPAEYEKHRASFVIWPHRPGSFGTDRRAACVAFSAVIHAIARDEQAYVTVGKEHEEEALAYLKAEGGTGDNISLLSFETDDSWARDVCPVFVTDGRTVRGIDFGFNAWGGEYNGLYADWKKDNELAQKVCKELSLDCYDAGNFILEGGSVHTDGEGTIMVTESCLLSPGRNPGLDKAGIEENLKKYLGGQKVLWLPRGIYNDETDEHVDNVCAFVSPAHVVLAWTDDKNDPQYALSKASLDYLENETDALGRKIKVTKLPIPDHPILVDEKLLSGYEFETGEDMREVGERLAASYVNFFFTNSSILVPVFGGENEESDRRAIGILEGVAGNRKVVPVPAMAILQGGGNIHCITMQLPQ
ncbi:MAG: agmatine deiminase [Lachnospiraceae bacterium]|nr:agmatine deiminase [Lachnospiraceae bacterium]